MSVRTNLIALTAAVAFMTVSAGCSHDHDGGHAAAQSAQPVSLSLSQGDAAGSVLLATHPVPTETVTSTADQFDEVD